MMAAAAHHEYEETVLKGERHEEWAAFYAAYVLVRLGDFAPASVLTRWLTEAPLTKDWAESAAAHILSEIPPRPLGRRFKSSPAAKFPMPYLTQAILLHFLID